MLSHAYGFARQRENKSHRGGLGLARPSCRTKFIPITQLSTEP